MDLLWFPRSTPHTITIIRDFRQQADLHRPDVYLRETMFEALEKLLGQEDESSEYVEAARADQEFWTFMSSTLARSEGKGSGLLVNSSDWRCILLELVFDVQTVWFSLANFVIYYALLKPSEKQKFFAEGGFCLLIQNIRAFMKALKDTPEECACGWQHHVLYGLILDLSLDDCLFTRRLLSEVTINSACLLVDSLTRSPMSLYIDSEHCVLKTEMIQAEQIQSEDHPHVCAGHAGDARDLPFYVASTGEQNVLNSVHTRRNFLSVHDWEQKIVSLVRPPRLQKSSRWASLPSVVTWHQNPSFGLRSVSVPTSSPAVERMSLDEELSPIEELDALMWLTTKMISRLISEKMYQTDGWKSFVNVFAAWKSSELLECVFASGKASEFRSSGNTSERDLMTLLFKHTCLVLQDVVSQVEKWDSNVAIPERDAPVSTITLRENFGGMLASLTYSELLFRSSYLMTSSPQLATKLVWEDLYDIRARGHEAASYHLRKRSRPGQQGQDGGLSLDTLGMEHAHGVSERQADCRGVSLGVSAVGLPGVPCCTDATSRLLLDRLLQGIGRIEFDPLALPRAALTVQRFEKLEVVFRCKADQVLSC
eukprot:756732-Hanusia_phi.AAC.6